MGAPDPSWTTRGHTVDTATRIAQQHLAENWATLAPEPDLPPTLTPQDRIGRGTPSIRLG